SILREIRYAFRLIRRSKGFALAVVLSTALGVGATASIFSLVDAFLLRPLPVPDTGRVVRVASLTQSSPTGRLSNVEVDQIAARSQSFEAVAAARNAVFGVSNTREEQARVTVGVLVNGGFFSALHVPATLGRTLGPADDVAPGRSPVVVLSHRMWQ